MNVSSTYRLCVLLVLWLGSCILTVPNTVSALVPLGSTWKYLDDGSDQGTAWTNPAFNDSAWASGPAPLGFGDGDETTVINGGPPTNRFITIYFRHVFDVTNTGSITGLTVRLLRDDGGVVYLNGTEIFRSNMPTGTITSSTLALTAAGGADESTNFYSASVPPGLLVSGANTLAVEIHQNAVNSSDLSFDLQLVPKPPGLPPISILTSPANGATFLAPATILLSASAGDADGMVTEVAFFAGTNQIEQDATTPYTQVWSNVPPGDYQLTAVATDDDNLVGVSAPVNITVLSSTNPPPVPPTIVTHPQSQTVMAGSDVSFFVEATGTEPLFYRWRRNSAPIPGGTNSTLTLFNVQPTNAGNYSVVVTNIAGSRLSSNAVLQVIADTNPPPVPPIIVTQPQSQTVMAGSDVSFFVEATGTEPLRYRWRRNNVLIPGATNSTLTLFNVQPTNAGNYSVIVSNIAGSRISSNAVLQVLLPTNLPPTVTLTSPTNGATFFAPATIPLSAIASDVGGTVTLVEFFAGTNKVAQDFVAPFTQVWSNVPPGNFQLTAVATDNSNAVTVSTPVNITVLVNTNPPPVPPTIVTQPQSQTVTAGANVSFSVIATGSPPLSYGWRRNGVPIPGATNSTLTLFNVQTNQAGLYRVVVSNLAGSTISSNALLQVIPAPFTNRPPSFTKGPDITVVEEPFLAAYFIPNWATNIRSGPTGEPPQNLTFVLTTDNPGLVGGLGIIPSNGALQFSVAPGTSGVANVTVVLMDDGGTANGGVDTSPPQSFVITVLPANNAPVASATISPLTTLFTDQTNLFVISPNNSNAPVVLDASLSSDPENDPLEFSWLDEGILIATGVLATNNLELGTHTITLVADDGNATDTDTVTFEVITAGDAVDEMIARVDNSSLASQVRNPLGATLEAARASFEAGNFGTGIHQLEAFQNKVEIRVAPDDPALAAELIDAAQAIIDAVSSP